MAEVPAVLQQWWLSFDQLKYLGGTFFSVFCWLQSQIHGQNIKKKKKYTADWFMWVSMVFTILIIDQKNNKIYSFKNPNSVTVSPKINSIFQSCDNSVSLYFLT